MNNDKTPIKINDEADELVSMIDSLMASGTQHINLSTGDETTVRTMNTSVCGKTGACAVPNLTLPEDKN